MNIKKLKKNLNWLLFIAIFMFIIVVVIYFLNFNNGFSNDSSDWGTFGDFLGGTLNPIFALFSLVAIIYTIIIQTEELKLTREELSKTTTAQQEQSESFKIQNESIQYQIFENNFFHFLNIHNDLVSKFRQINSVNNEKHYMYGGEAISFFLDKFKDSIERNYQEDIIDPETLKIHISDKLMRNNLKFIDNIYIILNLIDNANLSKEKQLFYINSILAQISDEELILIFYYTHAFREDMKSLIEKFAFFENMDEQLLYNWEEETKFYKQEAYGEKGVLYYV